MAKVLRHKRLSLAMAGVVAVPVAAVVAATANAGPTGTIFTWNGEEQTYTVPAGVTAVQVEAIGGTGGDNSDDDGYGGYGADVTTTLQVTPGDTLYIEVGTNGESDGDRMPTGPGTPDAGSGGAGGTYMPVQVDAAVRPAVDAQSNSSSQSNSNSCGSSTSTSTSNSGPTVDLTDSNSQSNSCGGGNEGITGGSGGSASIVQTCSLDAEGCFTRYYAENDPRLVVAGGGGGAGGDDGCDGGNAGGGLPAPPSGDGQPCVLGGQGGEGIGADGQSVGQTGGEEEESAVVYASGGGGATQTGPGIAGTDTQDNYGADSGDGPAGGNGYQSETPGFGGGGGGGYYGGGGGGSTQADGTYGAGGGAGSSYSVAAMTVANDTQANPEVVITPVTGGGGGGVGPGPTPTSASPSPTTTTTSPGSGQQPENPIEWFTVKHGRLILHLRTRPPAPGATVIVYRMGRHNNVIKLASGHTGPRGRWYRILRMLRPGHTYLISSYVAPTDQTAAGQTAYKKARYPRRHHHHRHHHHRH